MHYQKALVMSDYKQHRVYSILQKGVCVWTINVFIKQMSLWWLLSQSGTVCNQYSIDLERENVFMHLHYVLYCLIYEF